MIKSVSVQRVTVKILSILVVCRYFCPAFILAIATELRSFAKVEVAVLGSPSLVARAVSVDVKKY